MGQNKSPTTYSISLTKWREYQGTPASGWTKYGYKKETLWRYEALIDKLPDQWTSTKQYEAMSAEDSHSTAAAARLFNWRAGIYFNIRFVAGRSCRSHPILYFCGHGHKCLLDVGCTFCARFKEWDAQLVGILLQMAKEVM